MAEPSGYLHDKRHSSVISQIVLGNAKSCSKHSFLPAQNTKLWTSDRDCTLSLYSHNFIYLFYCFIFAFEKQTNLPQDTSKIYDMWLQTFLGLHFTKQQSGVKELCHCFSFFPESFSQESLFSQLWNRVYAFPTTSDISGSSIILSVLHAWYCCYTINTKDYPSFLSQKL